VTDLSSFPKIPEDLLMKMLAPPKPPVRIVIDSDVDNEVDDYFALTWILQSPESFKIEGVYAAPYSFRARTLQLNETYAVLQRGARGGRLRSVDATPAGSRRGRLRPC